MDLHSGDFVFTNSTSCQPQKNFQKSRVQGEKFSYPSRKKIFFLCIWMNWSTPSRVGPKIEHNDFFQIVILFCRDLETSNWCKPRSSKMNLAILKRFLCTKTWSEHFLGEILRFLIFPHNSVVNTLHKQNKVFLVQNRLPNIFFNFFILRC